VAEADPGGGQDEREGGVHAAKLACHLRISEDGKVNARPWFLRKVRK
jgi:hypothetical protein